MAESGDHVSDGTGTEADEDPELERLRAEEDEVARRVSAEVSEELSSHIAKLEQELKLAFDERMSALHQQCSTQAAEDISIRQVYQCVLRIEWTGCLEILEISLNLYGPPGNFCV